MEKNEGHGFDPVGRGRRAEVVFGAVMDAERTVMRGIVGEQLAHREDRPPSFLHRVRAVVRHEGLGAWRAAVLGGSGGAVGEADADAAVLAIYLQEAFRHPALTAVSRDEIAAMLVALLARAEWSTRLGAMKGPVPGEKRTGVPRSMAHGQPTPLWDELYLPLAELALLSFANLHVMQELAMLTAPAGKHFGWSPVEDQVWAALRFLILGQTPARRFQRWGFLGSLFVKHAVNFGLAKVVPFRTFYCGRCRRHYPDPLRGETCERCGRELEPRTTELCLSVNYLAECTVFYEEGRLVHGVPAR